MSESTIRAGLRFKRKTERFKTHVRGLGLVGEACDPFIFDAKQHRQNEAHFFKVNELSDNGCKRLMIRRILCRINRRDDSVN